MRDLIIGGREGLVLEPVRIITFAIVWPQRFGAIICIFRVFVGVHIYVGIDRNVGFFTVHIVRIAGLYLLHSRALGLFTRLAIFGGVLLIVLFSLFFGFFVLLALIVRDFVAACQIADQVLDRPRKGFLIMQLIGQSLECVCAP